MDPEDNGGDKEETLQDPDEREKGSREPQGAWKVTGDGVVWLMAEQDVQDVDMQDVIW